MTELLEINPSVHWFLWSDRFTLSCNQIYLLRSTHSEIDTFRFLYREQPRKVAWLLIPVFFSSVSLLTRFTKA